jgi:hypothetical protein
MQLIRQKQAIGNITPNNANKVWLTRVRKEAVYTIEVDPANLSLGTSSTATFDMYLKKNGVPAPGETPVITSNNENLATGVALSSSDSAGKVTVEVTTYLAQGACNIIGQWEGTANYCRVTVL